MVESHKHNTEWKQLHIKENTLYDSILQIQNKQNHSTALEVRTVVAFGVQEGSNN